MSDSFTTTWTIARQAPLSTGFIRQEYYNRLPFPSPGDLPDPRIEPGSPILQSGSAPSEPPGKPIWSFLTFISRVQAQAGSSQTQGFLSRQCLTDRKTHSRYGFAPGVCSPMVCPAMLLDRTRLWTLLISSVQILSEVPSTLSLIQQETLERRGIFPARRKHRQS